MWVITQILEQIVHMQVTWTTERSPGALQLNVEVCKLNVHAVVGQLSERTPVLNGTVSIGWQRKCRFVFSLNNHKICLHLFNYCINIILRIKYNMWWLIANYFNHITKTWYATISTHIKVLRGTISTHIKVLRGTFVVYIKLNVCPTWKHSHFAAFY